MRKTLFFLNQLLLLALCNAPALWKLVPWGTGLKILCIVLLAAFAVCNIILGGTRYFGKPKTSKLKRCSKGAYLIDGAVVKLCLEVAALIVFIIMGRLHWSRLLADLLCAFSIIGVEAIVGIVRTVLSSRQVKIINYVLLALFWYVPVVNVILLKKISRAAHREFRFEQAKLELNETRKESEVCKTRYPILMVHGIFFRDWQVFNYWGRVPGELQANGAEVYYGKQQSANLISISARELADRIKEIIDETGAEKLNIIAHSKGGLDSRYAISCLGMDKYVASLTTINTPHEGCKFVDNILSKVSDGLMQFVAKRYNKLFTVLGDTAPDFEKGVKELTYASAQVFNEKVQDMPGVHYASYMTKMNSGRAAGFPLNFGYMLNKPYGSGNDGLVTVESGLRWEDQHLVEHKGKRGISHGDVIDLFRENIQDYDVREFYVDIVKGLKEKGL